MKIVIISALVAVVASMGTTLIMGNMGASDASDSQDAMVMTAPEINYDEIVARLEGNGLSVSEEPEAAAWIRGGSGAAQAEQKILANAANSACFLTHVEINGIQGPEDKNMCSITVDDFTGFWQVNAITGEGTRSELMCNARCVVWE